VPSPLQVSFTETFQLPFQLFMDAQQLVPPLHVFQLAQSPWGSEPAATALVDGPAVPLQPDILWQVPRVTPVDGPGMLPLPQPLAAVSQLPAPLQWLPY